MPFGLKVGPSLFQQIMDTMLSGLEYTMAYLDDIVIKRRINQLRPRYIETIQNNEEIPMEVLYDSFQIKPPMNIGMPIEAMTKQKTTDSSNCESTRTERRISSWKRKRTKHLHLNPKRKKY